MIYLANSFSVQMLDFPDVRISQNVRITRVSGWEAGRILRAGPFVSVYGHRDTARLLARYWRMWIPVNREPIRLLPGDRLVVASCQRDRNREAGYDREHKPVFRFYLVRLVKSGEIS